MTVEATVDYAGPKPQRSDQALRAQAPATVIRLLGLHPEAGKEVQEIWRTRVHLQELTQRAAKLGEAALDGAVNVLFRAP